ncbi:MAG: putative toxin-antitoxin system toxin component, PIN family [Dehalococcoidia bacterium]
MPPIAVFDTNVLLSAIGWRGPSYRCLELARSGSVDGLSCQGILNELAEKLEQRLHFSAERVARRIDDLTRFLRLVPVPATLKAVPNDPDDDMVIECAVVGGATHIITGDKRHLLPLDGYRGIRIVTPAAFLALVAAAEPSP